MGMGGRKSEDYLLYPDKLILCGKLDEDLKAMVGSFVEVCRRGPKVSAGMNKVKLGVEE